MQIGDLQRLVQLCRIRADRGQRFVGHDIGPAFEQAGQDGDSKHQPRDQQQDQAPEDPADHRRTKVTKLKAGRSRCSGSAE
jgi:hypothetical protein